jgi:uncharacterized protein DUF4154
MRRRAGLLLLFLAILGSRALAQAPATETQLKAVFLYNFTKYVGWPTEAFAGPAAPLNVCVLGRDPFGPVLEETLRGETVNDRRLAARDITRPEDAAGCQILFISESEEGELASILRALDGKPILTVGEMERFAESGGMIRLRRADNKIRLEINETSAARAGLRISSQLLKLARIVSSPS